MRPGRSPYLTLGKVALEQRRESFKVEAFSVGQERWLWPRESIKHDHAPTDFADIPRGQPRPRGALVPFLRRGILQTSTQSIEFTVSLLGGEIAPHAALVAMMVQRRKQRGQCVVASSEYVRELVGVSHAAGWWSRDGHSPASRTRSAPSSQSTTKEKNSLHAIVIRRRDQHQVVSRIEHPRLVT
jgi:hypothetical protein